MHDKEQTTTFYALTYRKLFDFLRFSVVTDILHDYDINVTLIDKVN